MGVVRQYGRLIILLGMTFWASTAGAELTVGNLTLVDSTRVSRTHFEYTYSADISNTGGAVENATATVASSVSSTTIQESSLVFGDVAANATVTGDTFTFLQDRTVAFDPAVLSFAVTATPVFDINLPIGNLRLSQTGKTRVGRSLFEFSFQARLTNTSGTGAENVVIAVSSSSASTAVQVPELTFGNVPAGSTVTSPETFILQQDRTVAFDPSALNFDVSSGPTDIALPTLTIVNPSESSLVSVARPVISIEFNDDTGVDTSTIAFTFNNAPLSVNCQLDQTSGRCTPATDLPDGTGTLAASVQDTVGKTANAQVTVLVDSTPVTLGITSPADGFITTLSDISVTGTAGPGVTSVRVNDIDATLTGGNFTATVPLREGKNMLVAVGAKDSGKTGTSSVDITRDIVAPIVKIDSPRDGFNAVESSIAVTGLVNDIVSGGVDAQVLVNGLEATVSDGTFLLVDLPLVRGPNVIEVVATDAVGNESRDSITVNFQAVTGKRITVLSGNGQAALTNQELPQPLVIEVKDNLGNPVAGSVVTFEITRNSGLIRANSGDTGKRSVQVPTNGSGQAAVLLRLGDTAGEGNNRITATSPGVAGEVEFCASALAAQANAIQMVVGDNQRGIVGQPLAQPLEAMVIDKDGNPIKNLPVTFSVTRGGGNLDGQAAITKTTGTDGIARAVLTLGPEPGINNNIVEATFEGATTLSAAYLASGVAPGNPADTQFTGVVLDNAHTPIPGAVVSIIGSSASAVTDSEGQFLLTGVPVGKIHLHTDPSGSSRTEKFPPLDFETVTIAGQVNILGQPILLPFIQTENEKLVGGVEDVTLFMPGVDGMSLTVKAGSATFPNGDKTGLLSISQVHLDKVPMPPPNGSLFMPPAWTIQPAGVKFDPPAEITIPNDGLPPGRVIDIFQFDHTLNQFINVGKGVVSDDGFNIVSDNGFGITRTGWGGCGLPPPPDTCTRSCGPAPQPSNECQEVESPDCPGCPFLTAADPSKRRTEQTPHDCSVNTCGGPELDPSDPPEDQPTDCIDEICEGPPEPDDSETPEDDCQICQGGSPQPDPANDGNTCKDGCGTCVNGSCDVTDPNRPKENQTPNDCKTELCDGTTEANPGDEPTDECKTCDGTDIIDKPNTPKPQQTANNCQVEMCDGSFNPDAGDKPQDTNLLDCKRQDCFIDFTTNSARLVTVGDPSQIADNFDQPNNCAIPACDGNFNPSLQFSPGDNTDKCMLCVAPNQKEPKTTSQAPPLCNEFQCDPATGSFNLVPKPLGADANNQCLQCDGSGGTTSKPGPCDDGDPCTEGDACTGGVCRGTLNTSLPGCADAGDDDDSNDVTVRLTMFIPVDHVTMPQHPVSVPVPPPPLPPIDFVPLPIWDDIAFTGDNRDFAGSNFTYYDQENKDEPLPQGDGIAYRIAQEFTFRPGSGIINRKQLSGTTMRFDIDTSMTDGSTAPPTSCYRKVCPQCTPYAPGRPMKVPGQCLTLSSRKDTNLDGLFGDEKEAASKASTSSMTVFEVNPSSGPGERVAFRMKGNPANSIVPLTPEILTFSITWEIYIEFVLVDGKAVSWKVQGRNNGDVAAHDGFPAYELEVNKQVIYTHDPIPNGFNPDALGAILDSSRILLNISGSAGL